MASARRPASSAGKALNRSVMPTRVRTPAEAVRANGANVIPAQRLAPSMSPSLVRHSSISGMRSPGGCRSPTPEEYSRWRRPACLDQAPEDLCHFAHGRRISSLALPELTNPICTHFGGIRGDGT